MCTSQIGRRSRKMTMRRGVKATVFERFQQLTDDQMVILISHRFSTVRMAVREDHKSLLPANGHYARLFSIQAVGYR